MIVGKTNSGVVAIGVFFVHDRCVSVSIQLQYIFFGFIIIVVSDVAKPPLLANTGKIPSKAAVWKSFIFESCPIKRDLVINRVEYPFVTDFWDVL